ASRAGHVNQYYRCLAEPLRSEIQRLHPNVQEWADSLRREMQGVKTWVQVLDTASDQGTAQVDVDEVRMDGSRRIHFRLQRFGSGWLIVGLDPPKLRPASIPYGTHISQTPEEMPRTPGDEPDQPER